MYTSADRDDVKVIPVLQGLAGLGEADKRGRFFDAPEIDLDLYDRIVVCMSGGKDSWASLLRLIELGADRSKIELWHHDVDGREGSNLMDWPFMADYNRKLAAAMGMPLYFSWLEGGFEGEMLKENAHSRPHHVETPDGVIVLARETVRAKPSSRLRFPQVGADMNTRWCSGALKIDVGRRALTNQPRFNGLRTLFITGERRQESSMRSKYFQLEPHHSDRRCGRTDRHIDSWRPVLHYSEDQVWETLERHGVIAPVPYRLGWSRSSCMTCIYNSPAIWSAIAHYFPERALQIAGYEEQFGVTISRDRINVLDLGARARPIEITDIEALEQAMQSKYTLPILLEPGARWVEPVGAFRGEACGAG